MIERNLPLGFDTKTLSKKDTELFEDRVLAEVREVDRRLEESEVYFKHYAAKFEPYKGATGFSLAYQYRIIDIGKVRRVIETKHGIA